MAFITDEIISEGGITGTSISATTITGTTIYGDGSNLTGINSSFNGGTVTGGTIFTNGISANTITITTTPTLNNTNTQILSINTSTGNVEYVDSTTLGSYSYGKGYAQSIGNYFL